MIVWDMNPVIVSIGPLEIHWYGLVYMLGFLLAYFVLLQAAKKNQIKHLTKKVVEDYIFLLIMGSILAGRLFYVIVYNPAYYFRNLLEIPAVWNGGMSIHGGLLGAAIVTWYFCKKHKINFYELADLLVIPLALAYSFGRIANFVNGELWGTVTDVAWCVQFPGVEGCRHPSQIYQAAYGFVIFFILYAMRYSKKFASGVVFWSFITLYGLFRFFVTFFRDLDPGDPGLLGLGIGQWLSLAMVALGLLWFRTMMKTGHPIRNF